MTRLDPFRRRAPFAAMAVAVVIACSSPTDLCGCTPPLPTVMVVGTMTHASGAPVVGARLLFDGVPQEMSFDPPLQTGMLIFTDAEGAFSGRAHTNGIHSGELTLRAGVIEAGSTDTLRFRLGLARFRDRTPFDTVRVAIAIP